VGKKKKEKEKMRELKHLYIQAFITFQGMLKTCLQKGTGRFGGERVLL